MIALCTRITYIAKAIIAQCYHEHKWEKIMPGIVKLHTPYALEDIFPAVLNILG